MTIKGTLETFNLRELLQMLSFNQKEGTLVLETERGTRTIYVEKGRVAFVAGDPEIDRALLKVLRRMDFLPHDRLARAWELRDSSQRHLVEVLQEMGAVEQEALDAAGAEAAGESFLTLQLTSVSRFEFVDGQAIAANGQESRPLDPWLVVDSLLLDLTRKMDQWAELRRTVSGLEEVYEPSGVTAVIQEALDEVEIPLQVAETVLPRYDGFRTLREVAEVAFADELTTMQLTVVFLETGLIRPVPTSDLAIRGEDLLSRGEAQRALPLLRLSIEREDAVPETRLRVADALVALGLSDDAATELDTFASLAEDRQPRDVFDALYRALSLRKGEPSTATRVCDFYLRNRPWLVDDRREEAIEALRALIHGAVTQRRPREAADRLAAFIENGDASTDDLLVLADLYAAAGEAREAASALYARAQELLDAGRKAAGKELLERTLQQDPSRADARSRLHALQGASRKSRRRRRVVIFLVLLAMLVTGAGAAWWTYSEEADRALSGVREAAQIAVTKAKEKALGLIATFEVRTEQAAQAPQGDPGLLAASQALIRDLKAVVEETEEAVAAYSNELERYPTLANQGEHAHASRTLDADRKQIIRRAEMAVAAARKLGVGALEEGERAHRAGRFGEARAHLLRARNLALDDDAQALRAGALLSHVDDYVAHFDAEKRRMEEAYGRGNIEKAFHIGVDLLKRQLESDLTRGIRLPVRVQTTPRGATVVLSGTTLDARTPCVVHYSPFASDTTLRVHLTGCVPAEFMLPSFEDIATRASDVAHWSPHLDADLPAGPCWRVDPSRGPFKAMWDADGVAMLLTRDGGGEVQPVHALTGELDARRTVGLTSEIRKAGYLDGHVEWFAAGLRTIAVKMRHKEAWNVSVLGEFEQAPVVDSDVLVCVDQAGHVYGFTAAEGEARWRAELRSTPSQPPRKSAVGILVGTTKRGGAVFDAQSGSLRRMPFETEGYTQMLPFGDGYVVLGGGSDDIRVVGADGRVTVRGAAYPLKTIQPVALPGGIAWVEGATVRWLAVEGDVGPVSVTGLSDAVKHLSGRGDELFAIGRGGRIYAARTASVTEASWSSPVAGQVQQSPLVLESHVLVLVNGGVVAFSR